MYKRKTDDEFNIEQQTVYGWEMVTCEITRKQARETIKEYRENQPGNYRIVKKRVKIENS